MIKKRCLMFVFVCSLGGAALAEPAQPALENKPPADSRSMDDQIKRMEEDIKNMQTTQKQIQLQIAPVNKENQALMDEWLLSNYKPKTRLSAQEEQSIWQDITISFSEPYCYSFHISNIVVNGSDALYNKLYKLIKNKDHLCRGEALKGIEYVLKDTVVPKKCLQKQKQTRPVCKAFLKEADVIKNRVLKLVSLVYGESSEKPTQAVMLNAQCNGLPQLSDEIIAFQQLLEHWQAKADIDHQCRTLKPGQTKAVQPYNDQYFPYTLKRDKDGSYKVILNLKFEAHSSYDGPAPVKDVHKYYMSRVKGCLESAGAYLLGPDGEKLSIIPDNDSKTPARRPLFIMIGSQNGRSNANAYTSNINCAVITHEVLHLLGLRDEYTEKIRGFLIDTHNGGLVKFFDYLTLKDRPPPGDRLVFKRAYDCRVVQPFGIMVNEEVAWNTVFGFEPAPAVLAGPVPKSLLAPAQFNAILYGACPSKNKQFNKCSKLAYQSSVEDSTCLEKKKSCEKHNLLGL